MSAVCTFYFVSHSSTSERQLASCIKQHGSAALVVVAEAPSGTGAHGVTNESYKCVSFASKDGDKFQSDTPRHDRRERVTGRSC